MQIGTTPFSSMEKLNVELSIDKDKQITNYRFFHSYIEELLSKMYNEKRITKYRKIDKFSKTVFYFTIYKLDKNYVHRKLEHIFGIYHLLKNRLDLGNTRFNLFLEGDEFSFESPQSDSKMTIKHFDRFLIDSEYSVLPEIMKLEILKILEWTNYPNRTNDKKYAFMSLWSIMEFLLIDSVEDNKIDTINKNFVPYLSLFHFRKSIKLFFKEIIYQMNQDLKKSAEEIEDFIDIKLTALDINILNLTIVDKFSIFLFTNHKNLKKPVDKWSDFTNENVNKDMLIAKTITLTQNINNDLNIFEDMLKNDIKQIYRLRNMLTHSGENDGKILDNTFYRLKYYAQTLLNAISYSWIHNKEIQTLAELHELKRFDALQFKKYIAEHKKEKGEMHWINLYDFKDALVRIPKSSFSFIEKSPN